MFDEVRDRRDGESGAELLEFIMMIPFLFMVGLISLQLILFGHTAVITANAAREGARAAATNESVGRAVDRAIGNSQLRYNYSQGGGGDEVSVRVRVQIPKIAIPFIPDAIPMPWTDSTAVMRKETKR